MIIDFSARSTTGIYMGSDRYQHSANGGGCGYGMMDGSGSGKPPLVELEEIRQERQNSIANIVSEILPTDYATIGPELLAQYSRMINDTVKSRIDNDHPGNGYAYHDRAGRIHKQLEDDESEGKEYNYWQ